MPVAASTVDFSLDNYSSLFVPLTITYLTGISSMMEIDGNIPEATDQVVPGMGSSDRLSGLAFSGP